MLFLCAGLILGVASRAPAIDDLLGIQDLRFNGYLMNATALRLHDNYDFLKIYNILDLRLTYEPKKLPFKFHIDIRPEFDGAFDMQHKGVGSDKGLTWQNRGIGIGREQFYDNDNPDFFTP